MVAKKSSTDETAAEGKQLSLLTDIADDNADGVAGSTTPTSATPPAVAKAKVRNSRGRTKRRLTDPMDKIRPSRDLYAQLLRLTDALVKDSLVRTRLFQKCEKQAGGIVVPIMQSVNKCLRLVIAINMYNPNLDREATLREVTVELKVLATYIDAACQAKHITPHKCEVWQRQVNGVDNLAVGLAMGLQRARQEGEKNRKSSGGKKAGAAGSGGGND